jgi:S1-C subfamily serine protease
VVTNAHVIAGEQAPQVVRNGVDYRTTPVYFDPNYDLAILRTDAPLGPPLDLATSAAPRGAQGAVVGYPENGPLTVSPAGVAGLFDAAGRNIYNEGLVLREIYQLDAKVQPGNSGSPLVTQGGTVVGMVFSRSTVYPDVGYALTSSGVLSRVQRAAARTLPVSTGSCVHG